MALRFRPSFHFPRWRPSSSTSSPSPDGWQYEPKWDGFRGSSRTSTGELHLWSRNGRPLLRYFPELEGLGKKLKPNSAVDGEIVIERDGALDFDALQMRLHPAESRVRKLSEEIPAEFVVFDLLLWDGEAVHELAARGAAQARREAPLSSLAHDARPQGGARLARPARGGGLRRRHRQALGVPYLPGSRDGVVKVKGRRPPTASSSASPGARRAPGSRASCSGSTRQGQAQPRRLGLGGRKRREEILERVEPLSRPQARAAPPRRAEPLEAEGDREWSPVRRARRRGALRQVAEGTLPPRHARSSASGPTRIRAVHGRPGEADSRRRATLRCRRF